jgi:membrane-associated phospholipid phosphatase
LDSLLRDDRHFWPVDKVILAYFGFVTLLLAGWWSRIPGAPLLLGLHIAGTLLLLIEIRYPNWTTAVFRHWYPLVYVSFCYREMALFIPVVRHKDLDGWLARLDHSFWGADPTVWLERIVTPAATEYLQIVYTLFVPVVLLVALLLWINQRYADFRYYAFLIALGYLVSYVGYLIVPARGPRFLLKDLQHVPLQGMWFFQGMQHTLDRLESAHYDCFPSGHTELTILAWWSTRRRIAPLFWPYFAYTVSIIFATVYLRYHYTIDVVAGVAVAIGLLAAAPVLYRNLLEKRGFTVGRS